MADLAIRSRGNVTLEARWDVPEQTDHILVLCHPHPEHGGTMTVPLLGAITSVLVGANIAVLRFNFRGVEGSTGVWSGGIDEIDDVSAAAGEARATFPDHEMAVAGWSFGGATSLRWIARDREEVPWIGIAAPIRSALTPQLPPRSALPDTNRTFIIGDRDQFISVAETESYAASVGGVVKIVRGSDHFFYFRHDRVGGLVAEAVQADDHSGR